MMLSNSSSIRGIARRFSVTLTIVFVLVMSVTVFAQTTISTGSIQGTVSDPSGALVSGAKVKIINKATGQIISTTTSSAGTYSSGALIPADYMVRVEAKGFKTTELPVSVQVGVTAPGNVKLQVGEASEGRNKLRSYKEWILLDLFRRAFRSYCAHRGGWCGHQR